MESSTAWAMIAEINWAETQHENLCRLQVRTVRQYGYTMDKLYNFCLDRYNELATRCLEITIFCGSDDSFSDSIWHAIGLGETYFNRMVANPADMVNGAESFAYLFIREPEEMTLAYWQDRAVRMLFTLESCEGYVAIDLRERFSHMADGNIAAATIGFESCLEYDSAGTAPIYQHYYQWDDNPDSALFSNTLWDAYMAMVDSPD